MDYPKRFRRRGGVMLARRLSGYRVEVIGRYLRCVNAHFADMWRTDGRVFAEGNRIPAMRHVATPATHALCCLYTLTPLSFTTLLLRGSCAVITQLPSIRRVPAEIHNNSKFCKLFVADSRRQQQRNRQEAQLIAETARVTIRSVLAVDRLNVTFVNFMSLIELSTRELLYPVMLLRVTFHYSSQLQTWSKTSRKPGFKPGFRLVFDKFVLSIFWAEMSTCPMSRLMQQVRSRFIGSCTC